MNPLSMPFTKAFSKKWGALEKAFKQRRGILQKGLKDVDLARRAPARDGDPSTKPRYP